MSHAASVASKERQLGVVGKRARRRKTTEEFPGFLRRALRAFASRIAAGDDGALPELVALASDVDAAVQSAVDGLRSGGLSWTDIGNLLGMSRQGARQRWSETS